jgi:hypothetical protein
MCRCVDLLCLYGLRILVCLAGFFSGSDVFS